MRRLNELETKAVSSEMKSQVVTELVAHIQSDAVRKEYEEHISRIRENARQVIEESNSRFYGIISAQKQQVASVTDDFARVAIDKIDEQMLQRLERKATLRDGSANRLNVAIKALTIRGNLNLMIGMIVNLGDIAFFLRLYKKLLQI